MARAKLEPTPIQPDLDEEKALDRAAEALGKFMAAGAATHRSLAAVAISEWIIARTKLCAAPNFNASLLFNLKDARLRGFVEASLPAVGNSVLHLPSDVAFFSLERDQVVDLGVAFIKGAEEARGSTLVSMGAPFNDEIPFS